MPRQSGSAGVEFNESEVLVKSSQLTTLAIGLVGGASKGLPGITPISAVQELRSTYGDNLISDYGIRGAELVIQYTNKLYYNRAVASSASKGTAGDYKKDVFSFQTKEFTSLYNGYMVAVNFDMEDGTIAIRLLDGGAVVKRYSQFSIHENERSYIGNIFNSKSDELDIIINEELLRAGNLQDYIITIRGGNNGIDELTEDDIVKAIKDFKDPEAIDISTLVAPGWSSPKIIQALEEVVDYRGDIMAIPDPPRGLDYQGVVHWTNATGEFSNIPGRLDNQWLAVYWPWVGFYDKSLKTTVFYPPSAVVAAQYALNDSIKDCWFAPAGMQDNDENSRGKIRSATCIEFFPNKEQRDFINGDDNVVNPITRFQGKGIFIWGNKTTKRCGVDEEESFHCYVSARRLSNYIRKIVIDVSMAVEFNPNDDTTWKEWKLRMEPKLREIKDSRGINKYRVVMDETTVTEEAKRQKKMPGYIYVWPIEDVEKIIIGYTVTNDNVYFTETSESAESEV